MSESEYQCKYVPHKVSVPSGDFTGGLKVAHITLNLSVHPVCQYCRYVVSVNAIDTHNYCIIT